MKPCNPHWPFVSIIIVNLNGKKWLEKCFKSVLASCYPPDKFEIILVDNGSIDGSVEFIKGIFVDDPRIRFLSNERNLGWSPANNEGIRLARGEILVCLSNDMEVDPQWLRQIVCAVRTSPKVGVVQCNSLSIWDRTTYDSAMNYLDRLGYAYGYAPRRDEPVEVFFAEGMAFAATRKVIEEVGMLDDYYFMEYDDMDFSWRARLAGYSVLFVPSAKVYHARGATVGRTYFERLPNVTLYVRNHIATLIKNYELWNALRIVPIVTSMELAKIVYFFAKGEQRTAVATFKGLMQVLFDLEIILRKRRDVQLVRKVSDSEIMEIMHSFSLRPLFSFIGSQAKGKRFVSKLKPPIESIE